MENSKSTHEKVESARGFRPCSIIKAGDKVIVVTHEKSGAIRNLNRSDCAAAKEAQSNGSILHTLCEVAQFLRVSHKTVRRLIDEGKLSYIKVRGAIRVWDQDLAAYLQTLAP